MIEADPDDPRIGTVIAGRYDVLECIGEGGMGRVYRARQRSLGRDVAIKFVHGHMLQSPNVLERFMSEARAVSRLNHPNVVSVYDFGRTSDRFDADFFLVMELLSGSPLQAFMGQPMALPRVVSLVRQILAALGEAHHRGVVHRDVKPDNVLVERRRDGEEHVKVIDFGIARAGDGPKLTQIGQVVGTPRYMSPEHAQGREVGPSADLYAVAVILFELLTGRPPFEDSDVRELLRKQVESPRPDPCAVAPDRALPRALGEVCVRAMAIDASRRYPDAEAFAEALVNAAATEPWTQGSRSYFPPRSSSNPALARSDTQPIRIPRPGRTLSFGIAEHEEMERQSVEHSDLDATLALLAEPNAWTVAIHAPSGMGRTTVLRNAARALAARSRVIAMDVAAPPPGREQGYATLAVLLEALLDVHGAEVAVRVARESSDSVVRSAFRAIHASTPQALGTPAQARAAASAALIWTLRRAVARSPLGSLVLMLDDADRLDGGSLVALTDVICGEPIPGLRIVLSSEVPPDETIASVVRMHALRGWTRERATAFLGEQGLGDNVLGRHDLRYEPLYVEQCVRWWNELACAAPPTLQELVEWRITGLPPNERRVLQAVAIIGTAQKRVLAEILSQPEDLETGLPALVEAGFVRVVDTNVSAAHTIFARIALRLAPRGAVQDLHERAAAIYGKRRDSTELRAYHAIRSAPRMEALAMVERVAELRCARGDIEGAIESIEYALGASVDIGTARKVALREQLGSMLMEAGRPGEAVESFATALAEATEIIVRARLLEKLAHASNALGRFDQAEGHRRDALVLAQTLRDAELIARLCRPLQRSETGPRLRVAYRASEAPKARDRSA
ncbi:MAG: protein kinase domain-containing protein [Polyangiales bacterium]